MPIAIISKFGTNFHDSLMRGVIVMVLIMKHALHPAFLTMNCFTSINNQAFGAAAFIIEILHARRSNKLKSPSQNILDKAVPNYGSRAWARRSRSRYIANPERFKGIDWRFPLAYPKSTIG